MFKNVYLLLIGVFAMMLVGFLNTSDVAIVTNETVFNDNLLTEEITTLTTFGVTLTRISDHTYMLNGTNTGSEGYYSLTNDYYTGTLGGLYANATYKVYNTNTALTWSNEHISGSYTRGGAMYPTVFIIADDSTAGGVNLLPNVITSHTVSLAQNDIYVGTYITAIIVRANDVYDNYIFTVKLEYGDTATAYSTTNEVTTLVNGTDDYIQSIISASPYLVSMFVIVGVVSFLVTGKKEGDE